MPVVLVRVLVVNLRHRNYLFVRIFHRHAQQRRSVVSHYAVYLVVKSRILQFDILCCVINVDNIIKYGGKNMHLVSFPNSRIIQILYNHNVLLLSPIVVNNSTIPIFALQTILKPHGILFSSYIYIYENTLMNNIQTQRNN